MRFFRGSNPTAMEVEPSMSLTDIVVQRLFKCGVPMHYLERKEMGLVQYMKENRRNLQDILSALLPGLQEVQSPVSKDAKEARREFKEGCREGVRWVEWLMLEGDPEIKLKEIQWQTGHVRGVCGAVWGSNDIAYRCRTCENDPTCAICVPCFEAGNHVDHDYSMIRTGGGCCDCGDITAWKESGFCSQHQGPGKAPTLSPTLLQTFEPVLEALVVEWERRLQAAVSMAGKKPKKWESQWPEEKVASQTSSAIVEMLLEFCNCSESLLTYTGSVIASDKLGLLDIMLRSECFLPITVLNKLHELLFKLMGDPTFKFQFARAFIAHYPHFIRDVSSEDPESHVGSRSRDNPTLSSFSVQIFTVPTLTPRLVFDLRLLDMLMETFKEVCLACAGDDGRLLVSKGPLATTSYYRIVEDIRFALRHVEVAQYVARERPDLSKAWLHLLAYTQGMDAQRRQTIIHVEEETDYWFNAYILETQIANIHPLLIDGAAKTDCMLWSKDKSSPWTDISCREELEDEDIVGGHAKIGRISKRVDAVDKAGTSGGSDAGCLYTDTGASVSGQGSGHIVKHASTPDVPAALVWLISECAKILHKWLLLDASREAEKSKWINMHKGGAARHQKDKHRRERGGRGVVLRDDQADDPYGRIPRGGTFREWLRNSMQIGMEHRTNYRGGASASAAQGPANSFLTVLEEAQDNSRDGENGSMDWWMGLDLPEPSASLGFRWSERDWLEIDFDVSQQEVSFHLPLHRFLSLGLHKSVEIYAGASGVDDQEGYKAPWHVDNENRFDHGFILKLFPTGYQCPSFVSFLMEHPLRLQVFCAQVRAGMWRRNGHSVQTLCEQYYSVKWCQESSDLDLFLLQCCGTMAPPEEFVERIVSRFGLADYFSLFLMRPNEYETTLAQQMLSLVICIVAERGFCGSSPSASARRELIRRLAICDATHSQLMKSLPPRLHDNKHWQEALKLISTYYEPSGMQQGRYSLRQECWKELDLYHPRWSAKDLQCAEERYMRACKSYAVVNQLPRWQKPFSPFQCLSRIATCGKVHDILRSVFFHAAFSEKISDSRAPEGVLITALHLLALGLDVCTLFVYDKNHPCSIRCGADLGFSPTSPTQHSQEVPPLLAKATERVYTGAMDGTELSSRQSLLSLLVLLMKTYNRLEGGLRPSTESPQGSIGVLIKSLLEKFANLHRGCMYEIEVLAPEILHRVTKGGTANEFSAKGEQSANLCEAEKRKQLARERQAAAMAKMKAAQEKFAASLQHLDEGGVPVDKGKAESRQPDCKKGAECKVQSEQAPAVVVCALCRDSSSDSPTSFLTFVQRSRLLAIAERGNLSWEKGETQEEVEDHSIEKESGTETMSLDNGNQVTQIRVELLNLIQMALNGDRDHDGPIDVEAFLELLGDDSYADRQASMDARMSESSSSEAGSEDMIEEENESSSESANVLLSNFGFIVKDEARTGGEEISKTRENYLVTVLQEYVGIVSRNYKEQQQQQQVRLDNVNSFLGQQRHTFSRSSLASAVEGLLLDSASSDDSVGVHMSSCGHAVHQECLDRYFSSLLQRYHSRALFEGLQIVDPDQGEFLCPVCRRLANSVLPSLMETSMSGDESLHSTPALSRSFMSQSPSRAQSLQFSHAMRLLCNAEELVWKLGFRKAISKPLPKALKNVFDFLYSRLCGLYFPERESNNNRAISGRVSQSLLLWDVLRYTILSSELAARTRSSGLSSRPSNNLDLLWKAADLAKGSVLPLLFRAARAIQNQNRQSLLLRARGMQLLVGSLCFGKSMDSLVEPYVPGDISRVLLQIDSGREGADILFWRRMADPVLAHDPFSTLLWLIFCLPPSFPASTEPFLSFVHLFYLVSVTQIIAFLGKSLSSELQLSSRAQHLVENVITCLAGVVAIEAQDDNILSGPSLLALRRFTLPYLRRCALLERLLYGACEEPKAEKLKTFDAVMAKKAVDWINSETRKSISDAFEDLKELEELEQKFGLPSLQAILEDETIHESILRWCCHLSRDFKMRKNMRLPRPLMASPFKLMQLPLLYQTLLQRYIKERCPVCQTVPEQPALCLLCGTLCCAPSHRSCCSTNRQSECFRHALICGGGFGVFLLIRKTNVLLQRCARQASWPSPYLDSFGEEDIDMSRGKPLCLNEERYAALTAMIASHGLDHSSQVLSHTTWETLNWG